MQLRTIDFLTGKYFMNIGIYTNVYSIVCMIVVDRWNIKGLSVGINVHRWISIRSDDPQLMHIFCSIQSPPLDFNEDLGLTSDATTLALIM